MSAVAARLVPRCTLAELCAALGISRRTFYRHWHTTFTRHATPGGHLRFSADEVTEAQGYADPHKARAAVLRLRRTMGRL